MQMRDGMFPLNRSPFRKWCMVKRPKRRPKRSSGSTLYHRSYSSNIWNGYDHILPLHLLISYGNRHSAGDDVVLFNSYLLLCKEQYTNILTLLLFAICLKLYYWNIFFVVATHSQTWLHYLFFQTWLHFWPLFQTWISDVCVWCVCVCLPVWCDGQG